MQKLYCYVDETGQDIESKVFIVVAVIGEKDQELIRRNLLKIEAQAKTGQRKWHKSRPERRLKYLELVLDKKVGFGEVFYGVYTKPLPYFLPVIDVLEKSIAQKAQAPYQARIYIDGIDRKKAEELTNALRLGGLSLESVKSRRDESEPIIRLADMWAGCIRAAINEKSQEKKLLAKALQELYLNVINK